MLPPAGTKERYEVVNVLSYVGTEYHKTIGNLFNPTLSADVKSYFLAAANTKLQYINDVLVGDKSYVVGGKLSVADLYLYITLSWSGYIGLDLSPFPNVQAFFDRIGNLDGVKAGHAAMSTKPATTA